MKSRLNFPLTGQKSLDYLLLDHTADMGMEINLNRLKRDFEGRVLYHTLLRKGMVSAPVLATANAGITGDPSKDLNINERIYRITAQPEFNHEQKSWLPTPRQFIENNVV